jgi:hypothetical protein
LRTLENTDGGGEVVDTAGGLEGGSEDLDGGDKIVGEAVVQVALDKSNQSLVLSRYVCVGLHEDSSAIDHICRKVESSFPRLGV